MPNPNMVIRINRTPSEFIGNGLLILSRFIFRNTFDVFFFCMLSKEDMYGLEIDIKVQTKENL
jgi:hypothetical protein